MGKIIYNTIPLCIEYLHIFVYSFDPNDEEVQSEGDDDDEVNENDSEDEGVYEMH